MLDLHCFMAKQEKQALRLTVATCFLWRTPILPELAPVLPDGSGTEERLGEQGEGRQIYPGYPDTALTLYLPRMRIDIPCASVAALPDPGWCSASSTMQKSCLLCVHLRTARMIHLHVH